MCIYQGVRKNGVSHIGIRKKKVIHILFIEKRGPIIYLAGLKREGHSARISALCHIKEVTLPPPPPPPPTHLNPARIINTYNNDGEDLFSSITSFSESCKSNKDFMKFRIFIQVTITCIWTVSVFKTPVSETHWVFSTVDSRYLEFQGTH